MKIKLVDNQKEWDSFLSKQRQSLFTQYSAYGEFYKLLGEKMWIVGIYDQGKLIGGSLVVSVHAKRGNFLFLPYGPVINFKSEKVFAKLIKFISKLAEQKKYNFVRVSPFLDDTVNYRKLFADNGFCKAPIHMLAETTWLLDLSPNENDLLKNMKKNHRNLIRRCLREGVRINRMTTSGSLERLNNLHDITARKHNFHRFSRKYISDEFKIFAKQNEALVFEAYLSDGTLDSSSIIMFMGNMVAYRHSASLNSNRRLPTSYLVQWEVILEAKRRGKKIYNFWGIAPADSGREHPFSGITHFKKGFGGFQKDLLPCQDLPITFKYWMTYIIETVRRIKRGF